MYGPGGIEGRDLVLAMEVPADGERWQHPALKTAASTIKRAG